MTCISQILFLKKKYDIIADFHTTGQRLQRTQGFILQNGKKITADTKIYITKRKRSPQTDLWLLGQNGGTANLNKLQFFETAANYSLIIYS